MSRRNDCQHIPRCEQTLVEGFVSGRHQRQMDVTPGEPIRNAGTAILDQVNFDGGIPPAIGGQEVCEDRLDVLGATT